MSMDDYGALDPAEVADWKRFELAKAIKEKAGDKAPLTGAAMGVKTFGGDL